MNLANRRFELLGSSFDNLYQGGDVTFEGLYQLNIQLEPGAYIFSAIATSTDTDNNFCCVQFTNATNSAASPDNDGTSGITKSTNGESHSQVFVCDKATNFIYLKAAKNTSLSTGNTATFRNITIKKHSGTYDGIQIFRDNVYIPKRKNYVADVTHDDEWFIAGWYDSGSTETKSYTYYIDTSNADASLRPFNDKAGKSVDWWATSWQKAVESVTYQITGRYILFSVYKPAAAKTYLKINGEYIFSGTDVSTQ